MTFPTSHLTPSPGQKNLILEKSLFVTCRSRLERKGDDFLLPFSSQNSRHFFWRLKSTAISWPGGDSRSGGEELGRGQRSGQRWRGGRDKFPQMLFRGIRATRGSQKRIPRFRHVLYIYFHRFVSTYIVTLEKHFHIFMPKIYLKYIIHLRIHIRSMEKAK